jgi:serine/threonine protein kinase, bacterial
MGRLNTRLLQAFRRMLDAWKDYPLREGTVLHNRYKLVRFIGMGSYGLAYEGIELGTDRRVLLKMNKPSKGKLGIQLLQRESTLMQQLHHPQIPAWIDYLQLGTKELLVTELKEGRNLEDTVMEDGVAIAERDALVIVRSLVEPLGHLHAAGFVHRDVRIPNVILHEGEVSLIDYGLACGIGERLPDELLRGLGEQYSDERHDQPNIERGRFAAEAGRSGSPDVWHSVKRRMRAPSVTSDLYGVGHLTLFLLYSGYEAPDDRVRSWQEELPLETGTRELIARLLEGGDGGFRTAQELGEAIDKLLEEMEAHR